MPLDPLELAALREELGDRVRAILVDRLSVRCAPEAIDPDAPLFGPGLGLDSVDALELIIAVESELGVSIPEDEDPLGVLRSVGRIVDFVVAARHARTS